MRSSDKISAPFIVQSFRICIYLITEKVSIAMNIYHQLRTARVLIPVLCLVAYGCDNKPSSTSGTPNKKTGDLSVSSPDMKEAPANESISSASVDYDRDISGEGYASIEENSFLSPRQEPLSTFATDVDRASYSNVRRFLESGNMPPAGAVRIEELVNYFDYNYPEPTDEHPVAIHTEIADCPWNTSHRLLKIGIQGRRIATNKLPPSNLVFLVDVSGSMDEPNKLPLVQASLHLLTDQLRTDDKVAIITYAGNAGLVLPSTSGNNKQQIHKAIDELNAGGSTAGGAGIELAYKIARQQFRKEGNNRVIIATDGDFNVGASSEDELVRLIERERKSGVYLSVLGFGTGNYQDDKMQQLADKGNGNHAYIDQLSEARKLLVNEFAGTMFTIAKDVKIQVEFNPSGVQGYRLIGYENRKMDASDFRNDEKDAGEIGSGHTVTALYEIIPAGVKNEFMKGADSLRYQPVNTWSRYKGELLTVKVRYKNPTEEKAKELSRIVYNDPLKWQQSSDHFRFAAAVAEFGLLLRESPYRQQSNWQQVLTIARGARGDDADGCRGGFIEMVESLPAAVRR
jgi:Ca-activated chloride channel family protein